MYQLPVGGIVKMQILGRLHGQRTRTTFNYMYQGDAAAADGATSIADALADLEAQILNPILQVTSEEWGCEFLVGQLVAPTRYRAVVLTSTAAGAVAGSACPSAVAAVIRRFSDRSGHRFQGRVYLPGVPVSYEDDSQLAAGVRASYDTIVDGMVTPLEGSDASEDYVPIVSTVAPVVLNADQVQGAVLDPTLRYQRRRELGVGE